MLGLVYVTGKLIHKLSCVLNKLPFGVVNCGIAEPDIFIEKVLSLIFCKLSVALMVNALTVFLVTNVGVIGTDVTGVGTARSMGQGVGYSIA